MDTMNVEVARVDTEILGSLLGQVDVEAMNTASLVSLGREWKRIVQEAEKNLDTIGVRLKSIAREKRETLAPKATSIKLEGTENRSALVVYQNRVSCSLEGRDAIRAALDLERTLGATALPLYASPKISVTLAQLEAIKKWTPSAPSWGDVFAEMKGALRLFWGKLTGKTNGQEIKAAVLRSIEVVETPSIRYQG